MNPCPPAPRPAHRAARRRSASRLAAICAAGALAASIVAPPSSAAALPPAATLPQLAQAPTAPADDVPAALAPYYAQALSWAACDGGLSCAWLTVPLDYADPAGATIRIRVSKHVATGTADERRGSLVVNPGGPGASGTDYAAVVAEGISPTLGRYFDVVGFDTRGVGRSAPITCLTGRQTTVLLRADGTPDTAAERRRLMRLSAGVSRGCLTLSPRLARHVGSENTVKDLDILRQALGDPKLNWLGFSYGTYLGTLYADEFPDNVGRFVLDGAIDPSLDMMEVSKGQSDGFQVALGRFAADCSRRASCPYPGSAGSVLRGINRLLARLDVAPMPTFGRQRLVQAEALTAILYSMYSPQIWSSLRYALRQAVRNDGSGLQFLSDFANDRTGPNRYATNMASAFYAIGCWDEQAPPGAAVLGVAAERWARGARVPEMARLLSWGNAPCSQWFGHTDAPAAPASSTTTAPILIVGTTFDPATPYPWAVALSRQLGTSTLLTYRGDGHTAYGSGSSCIERTVDAYLIDGRLPPAGTVCR